MKLLGGIFLDIRDPDAGISRTKPFLQVTFFCCFREGVAGMSRELGRDVPDMEKNFT